MTRWAQRDRLTVTLILTLSALCAAAHAADPVYAPVKTEMYNQRDGLGHFFAKLEAGKDVKIAYLGGSITAMNGWRNKTLNWFREQYPKSKIDEIHAAIGGTGSDLGVFRLGHDALRGKPDLLFVEFSVNDGGADPKNIWRGMEGIVRQTWQQDPDTDICFVYTFRSNYEVPLTAGEYPRAAGADEMLAEHYGIPSINMALRITQLLNDHKLIIKPPDSGDAPKDVIVFSKDGVHPVDAGHQVYLEVIADAMQHFKSAKPVDHKAKLATPFIADNWEAAKMVPVTESMTSGGWKQLPPDNNLVKSFGNRMDSLWLADTPGQKLTFKFRGSKAALYDLLGPDGGQVTITVDGKTRGPVPRFDHYCTYHRIATLQIADGLDPAAVHTVTVEVAPGQPDRSSVTDREKSKPNFDPKKYDGANLRVGAIMLIGDLVE
ncbi:MAG: SGNH/GDSL hydrolase family protein [Phycisphaera sp.]|nr:SGNH/GDSL hydrolase family protein [Phycisphaera sp.]